MILAVPKRRAAPACDFSWHRDAVAASAIFSAGHSWIRARPELLHLPVHVTVDQVVTVKPRVRAVASAVT
jgi:hypothetical protein